MTKLYTFFRSSAAFRVRIALNLKGVEHELVPRHFRKEGGQHRKPDYLALNPMGLIPTLEEYGQALTQSLAIIEYLDEVYTQPKLLPEDPFERAQVRAFALAIACDIHPVNNLRILNYLRDPLGHDDETVNIWVRHWVDLGFEGLERMVEGDGPYCFGDKVTLADLCLVPQVFNAKRFGADMGKYPRLNAINDALMTIPAFEAAAPANQPDAE